MGSAVIILRAILILLVIFQDGLAESSNTPCWGVKVSKEVEYKLENRKDVHTKRISFEGYGLVIGSFTEHTLGKVNDYFKCTALSEKTLYNGNHDLEVLKWSNRNRFEQSPKERLNVAEHFVVIRQEVWNCRDYNRKLADIQRVVNEVISTSNVSEVKYYDGVLVERVNYESIDKYSAKVKDVKYITNNGKKWRFEGSLCLVEDENSATFGIPNFQANIRDERKGKPIDNSIELSKSGETLKIGYSMDNYDEFFIKIRCTLTSEGSQYSPLFTTNLYYVEESNRETPIKTRISDKEFSKFFTIIKREVYSCTTQDIYSGIMVRNYLRIVNEGIGMVPIKKLYYKKLNLDMKYIKVPGGISVRFKDVMYFDYNWKQGFFTSENVLMVEGHTASRRNSDNSIDIAYSLTPTTYYRSLIGSQGIDLRVGQFVSEPALGDSQSQTVTCSKASMLYQNKIDSFRTIVKAKINDNGVISSMIVREQGGSNIYRSMGTEVLLCKNSRQDLKFLRIVNRVEVMVAVRDIETCDGIYIVPKVLNDGQSMSVSITELKYLNETTFKPIKYGGTLQFEKPDLIQTTVDARRKALILSVEEAVRWNGQGVALDPYEMFRAYPSESERPNSLLPRSAGGYNDIVFNNLKSTDLSSLTIATCSSITVPGTDEFLTPFHVLTEDYNIDPRVIPVDKTRFPLYFTLLLHEEWLCLGKNSPEKFMRIVNKYEMKPNTPIPINHIAGFNASLGDYYVEKRKGKMIPIFTEVKYVMIDSRPTQFLNYRQYLLFPEQLKEKKGVGMARSGTVVITKNRYSDILEGDKVARVKGLSYTYRKAYQTKLSTRGVILEIGASLSKALTPITGTEYTSCSPGGTLPRNYKIPIMVNGKSDTDGSYLEMLGQEVWTCLRIGITNEKKFLFFRVVSYAMIPTQKITTIKELLYQDGVTISWMHNKDGSYLSVMEVRYFDIELQSMVKLAEYEDFKLEAKQGEKWKEVRKTQTKLVKRTNMEQILRRTVLEKKWGDYLLYIPITFDRQVDHSPDAFVCTRKNIRVSTSKKMSLVKGIQFYKYQSNAFFEVNSGNLDKWMDIKMFIQECKREQEKIYRVETLFDYKKDYFGTNYITVTRIHHHEGVTAVKYGDDIQIREIKFVDTLEDSKGTKVLQFDGLIWVEDPDPEDKKYELLGRREFGEDTDAYRLDSLPMMEFSTKTKKGIVLQIGSAWKDEVQVTEDMVYCKQFFPQEKSKHYDIYVYSLKDREWDQFDFWQKDIFQGQTQNVWVCMRNDEEIFYRVVNYMVLPGEIVSIYYTEGIHIGYLNLPDRSVNVEVHETKYLHPDLFHVLKYEGELQFVSEQQTLVERLFPLDYTAASPEPQFGYRELAGGGKYWSLGALAALAVREQASIRQSLAETKGRRIHRAGFNGVWSVASVEKKEGGGSRILHLGTQWQRDLFSDASTKGAQLKCMVHEWNQMYQTNDTYHPTVRELTRDNIHEFDQEMFETVFEIVQQDIRICVWENGVNRDIFLLIATKFSPLMHAHAQFAVAFMHDGVAYDGYDFAFHETVLINTRNNEYSKYSGEIGLITNNRGIQPGRDANIVTNANNNLIRSLFRKSKKKHNR
ncbi:uncharacterized protein LOC111052006 isoform X2 [Nilaparvata lugens]|uniref:uncharacterized protein LOC111052006 isoform X2 n=1 Tax=Nilaparvata lugens TaxID=108931 RepID=UPI00193D8421|nr:uncharacterized protein LOC111052006 isoform X2 [Nilaparvata lugens]